MSNRTIPLDDAVVEYLLTTGLRESPALLRLREETADLRESGMQIAPEQGQLMAMLVRLIGARRIVEVGTFTGYSALAMAEALPAHGRIITCDTSERWTAIARRHWHAAGVSGLVELRLGPAAETLERLHGHPDAGAMDMVFIDADKEGYSGYYEHGLRLVRPGGLLIADNALWHGRVADSAANDADTQAIRTFNRQLHADERVDYCLLPVADGLALARKR